MPVMASILAGNELLRRLVALYISAQEDRYSVSFLLRERTLECPNELGPLESLPLLSDESKADGEFSFNGDPTTRLQI